MSKKKHKAKASRFPHDDLPDVAPDLRRMVEQSREMVKVGDIRKELNRQRNDGDALLASLKAAAKADPEFAYQYDQTRRRLKAGRGWTRNVPMIQR